MPSPTLLLRVAHFIGLALGIGGGTVKLALLLRCRSDRALLPAYFAVVRPITRLIILGMVLVTLSGIGWLLLGYPFSALLVVKLVLVAGVWVLGPVIDNVAEPRFRTLAPASGAAPSPEFLRAQSRYLTLEVAATGLFYVVLVLWVLG